MKIFRFELRKLWRQKKLIWLLLIVLLVNGGIFFQNYSQQSKMAERAQEKITPFIDEVDSIYNQLKVLERQNEIDDSQLKQLEYVNGMATTFFKWKGAIFNKNWGDIPNYEYDFLTNLQQFENAGGGFTRLQGMEREQVIQKNAWLRENNIPYVDEEYPLSPALVLKDSTVILLCAAGILILLLFFGNTITVEKQQQTLLTLKTQPISKRRQLAAKYVSLLFVMVVYLAMVVGIGLIIPLIFGDFPLSLQYPQIMTSGDTFAVISTFSYLIRVCVLFICACTFAFSLILLFSTLVKDSFSMLMITGLVLVLGLSMTNMYTPLHSPLNPFQFFRFSQLIGEAPGSMDWLYPISAVIWFVLLMLLTILVPEKELGLFKSSGINKPFRNGETQKKLHKVWVSSIFEWRKLRRQGLLKQTYLILLLLSLLGYFAISNQASDREENYVEALKSTSQIYEDEVIPFIEESIEGHEKVVKESNDEGEIDNFKWLAEASEEYLEFIYVELKIIKDAVMAYENHDWKTFYDYQLFQNRMWNGDFDMDAFTGRDILGTYSQLTLDASMAEKEWLMERNIQPVFSGEMIPTIYDSWGENLEGKRSFEDRNRKVDNSGLFSLYLFFGNYLYFVPIILFLVLVGVGFASERGKKSTLHLLKIQPIGEENIFLGKVISALSIALLSCMGIFGFILSIGTIFNRFGDWDYPILHYNSKSLMESPTYTGMKSLEGGFNFLPLGDYLINTIALFLFVLLFLIVLSIFLSLFIKNQFSVIATVLLIGMGGYFLSNQMLTHMAHLSPFTYFNITKITNGEVSALVDNPSITVMVGCLVLLASTLLLFMIGYFFLDRKNRVHLS